jgi:hypothetical protein
LSLERTIACSPQNFGNGTLLAPGNIAKESFPLQGFISASTRTAYLCLDFYSVCPQVLPPGYSSLAIPKGNIPLVNVPPRTFPPSRYPSIREYPTGGMIMVDNLLRSYGGLSIYLPTWLRIRYF